MIAKAFLGPLVQSSSADTKKRKTSHEAERTEFAIRASWSARVTAAGEAPGGPPNTAWAARLSS